MTSKEALNIIQDNITPRTLGILTVEFNIVEKALDRLELLEKEKEQIKQWIANKIKYLDNGVFLMSYERTKGAIEILNELLKEVLEL